MLLLNFSPWHWIFKKKIINVIHNKIMNTWAFLLYMSISCEKIFCTGIKVFSLWPWLSLKLLAITSGNCVSQTHFVCSGFFLGGGEINLGSNLENLNKEKTKTSGNYSCFQFCATLYDLTDIYLAMIVVALHFPLRVVNRLNWVVFRCLKIC